MLDKVDAILRALEVGPASLAELTSATGIPRPTTHRLATALEGLGYVTRDPSGRFMLGTRIGELAAATGDSWLVGAASPILTELRDSVAESAQLYRRWGNQRLCVVSVEPASGLRDSVPSGTLLPLTAGSAAQVLIAWEPPETAELMCADARFNGTDLARVRRRGWAHTVAEREPGLASLSAPVRNSGGDVVAAVSVSGPIERIGRSVRPPMVTALTTAARRLTAVIAAR